jgi:phosphoenolpyruvate---glycerone phosphotransferase subunit DhaL
MNPAPITPADLRLLLAFVAEAIARKEAELNALDAAIGDGDHGITMRIGFTAVNAKINGLPEVAGIDAILRESGMAFMGATGGAIGVLLGKMLMAAGAALKGCPAIGPAEFRILLDSMESALASAGNARPGDKTMLDAVHAANEAVKAEEVSRGELVTLLAQAARAAQRAAQDTAQMLPQAGRASRLGERALGHPDPGAVSFSVLLAAMAEWAQQTSRPGG